MAGYATTDRTQKENVIELMKAIEASSIGVTTAIARRALERIYRKQHATIGTTGYDFSVDWITEIGDTGKGLVMFGL